MFWVLSQIEQSSVLFHRFFISLLYALEWLNIAQLSFVDVVLAVRLQQASYRLCPEKPTDCWTGESELSALDSNQSLEFPWYSDDIGCSKFLTSSHSLVVPIDCTAKPATNSCLKYYNAFFQFISVHKDILCTLIWRINILQGFETETKRKMSRKKAENNRFGKMSCGRKEEHGRKHIYREASLLDDPHKKYRC